MLGGDGTFLRAAEDARPAGIPLLGVNLGHVGFLAETEVDALDATVTAIVEGRYEVEQRFTLQVTATLDGEVIAEDWALNEASVEKSYPREAARGRGVGRRPAAAAVRLRRGHLRDAHRLDRLRLLGRRPDRLAERRGDAGGAQRRARAVPAAAGGGARTRRSASS